MKNKLWGFLFTGCATLALVGGATFSALADEGGENNTSISDVVGYKKGFYIQSPDQRFKLNIGGYIQGLFLTEFLESAPDETTFRMRRARLKFSGHMFTKNVKYALEYDFSGNKMLAGYIDLIYSKALGVMIGQHKVPFNLEALVSASKQQFVDRSIVHSTFGFRDERDIGIGLHGSVLDKKFEYALGIFNGDGLNTLNQNDEFMYGARLAFNAIGKTGKQFSDIKGSQDAHLAIAAGVNFNDIPFDHDNNDTTAMIERKDLRLTTDATFRYKGASAHGGFFYKHLNPEQGASTDDKGWLAQVGYFVMPKTFEVVGRVAQVYLDGANDEGEYTAGLNYYIHGGHGVKLQFDYSALTEEDGIAASNNRLDHRVRAQIQVKL